MNFSFKPFLYFILIGSLFNSCSTSDTEDDSQIQDTGERQIKIVITFEEGLETLTFLSVRPDVVSSNLPFPFRAKMRYEETGEEDIALDMFLSKEEGELQNNVYTFTSIEDARYISLIIQTIGNGELNSYHYTVDYYFEDDLVYTDVLQFEMQTNQGVSATWQNTEEQYTRSLFFVDGETTFGD